MDEKALIRVDVDTTLFVYCEPKRLHIQSEVLSCIEEHLTTCRFDIFYNKVFGPNDIPIGWRSCEPFGEGRPGDTCLQIANEILEEENKRKIVEENEKKQFKFDFWYNSAG